MPDVEPLRFPSREGPPAQQDQADLQAICSGRRRTCALLNSPLPCVDKAVEHIQELKMTVQNWCQQRSVKYPQTNHNKHQYNGILRFQARDSDSESVTSTELFIEGIAISSKEVMHLIERLEADRQYAEEALHKERQKKRILESKVDSITLWKQQEHALAVQKEHEAGVKDLAELKGRLELERGKLDQARAKVSDAEALNQRLRQHISSARAQIPLVRERLELQRGIVTQIKAARAEAAKVYAAAQRDRLLLQAELQKLEEDSSREKASQEASLSMLETQLTAEREELKRLKTLEDDLRVEIEDAGRTVALTEEKCAAMAPAVPETMELEARERDRILRLNLQIEDEVRHIRQAEAKLGALQEDVNKARLRAEAEVSCAEEQLKSRREAFASLRKENTELTQEIEDRKIRLSESEKAVKQMQGEQRQMLQKITDNDERWEKAREEVTQVVAQHGAIRAKLAGWQRFTFMEEEKARKEIEEMENTLSSQRSAVDLLKRVCENLQEEFDRHQQCSEETNLTLKREFEDSSLATKDLETKVQKIKQLIEDLEKIEHDHRRALVHLEKEKELSCERLKAAQDLHIGIAKRHAATLGMVGDLKKKSEDYRQASDQMETIAASLPDVIKQLQCDFDAVNSNHNSAALLMSTLQSDINNCQQRSRRSTQIHAAHVTACERRLQVAKEALKMALKENRQLASEYEGLKKTLMQAKQGAASALSRKNHVYKSLHYYTQLSLLQERMHKASAEYFKQRSLDGRARLDRCQALSHESDRKIGTAQARLSAETRRISAFLRASADDSATTGDGAANPRSTHDAPGDGMSRSFCF